VPVIHFTSNLKRHVDCPTTEVPGTTVADALAALFAENPRLGTYVLDEQGRVRKHVNIFVNGERIADRIRLSDEVGKTDEIFIFQALSGG